jgi:predicted phosphodiesterase
MYILKTVWEFILTFFTLISLIFSNAPLKNSAYEAASPEELIASFCVISDIHVETNDHEAYKGFTNLLRGIKAGKNHDAAIFLGDNTMNGQYLESYLFFSAVKEVTPAEYNLVALGNHDIGNGKGNYQKMFSNFLRFNKKELSNDIENTYYYKVINGCYLIFLATEDLTVKTYVMSDDQISWLEETLDKAKADGAPIFIFNHHPMLRLEGDDCFMLARLLNGYDNVLYVNGHTHAELTEYSFGRIGKVPTITLPRGMGTGEYPAGIGIVIEVYESKVLVRARNFIEGEWIEDLAYTYDIK